MGEELAQDLFDSNDKLLLGKGIVITEELIGRLKNRGFETVYVEQDESAKTENKPLDIESLKDTEVFYKLYDYSVFETKRVLLRSRYKHTLSETIFEFMDRIVEFLMMQDNPFKFYMLASERHKDYKHEYHALHTAILCAVIGRYMELDKNSIIELAICGCLHDIGKYRLPSYIFDKRHPLTKDEWKLIKRHPVDSAKMIADIKGLSDKIAIAALRHHERLDGSGYPCGCKGNDIPMQARIIAIAGTVDILLKNKPYAQATNLIDALNRVKEDENKLDPYLIKGLTRFILSNEQNKKYLETK